MTLAQSPGSARLERPSTQSEQLAVTTCGVVLAVLAEVALVVPSGFLDAATLVAGWGVLGVLHAAVCWRLLRRKAWWVHTAVMSALIVGAVLAGVAATTFPTHGTRALFVLPLVMSGIALCAARRAPRLATPGRCAVCEYNLFGLLHPRCPECGTAVVAGNRAALAVPA